MTTCLISVGQIGVPVKDINRAISFYKDLLELTLLLNTDTMAFFDCDNVRLMLSLPETTHRRYIPRRKEALRGRKYK